MFSVVFTIWLLHVSRLDFGNILGGSGVSPRVVFRYSPLRCLSLVEPDAIFNSIFNSLRAYRRACFYGHRTQTDSITQWEHAHPSPRARPLRRDRQSETWEGILESSAERSNQNRPRYCQNHAWGEAVEKKWKNNRKLSIRYNRILNWVLYV